MDQIPIPTDNIYKFYALFGLALFIFACASILYTTNAGNEVAYQAIVELQAIQQLPNPSPVDLAKKLVQEKRLEIMTATRQEIRFGSHVIMAVSIFIAVFGFCKWHKDVQPMQDEIARLQLEKLRHEVSQLKHAISASHKPLKTEGHKK